MFRRVRYQGPPPTDDLFEYIKIELNANILAMMVSVAGSGAFSANAVAMANVISNNVGARIDGSTVKAGYDDSGITRIKRTTL